MQETLFVALPHAMFANFALCQTSKLDEVQQTEGETRPLGRKVRWKVCGSLTLKVSWQRNESRDN
jgi:hypothetical protein